MSTTSPSMRADARRNRDKLLRTAGDVFAEAGTDVSLDLVAKRAGVGIGTLYRHFPTRDALVEAVYRSEVTALCEAADRLLAEHPPEEALTLWLERFVGYLGTKRGMANALQSVVASKAELYTETRRQMLHALGSLLGAGVEAGTIRADVDADDVLRAMSGVYTISGTDRWPEQAHKLVRLLMDGLRAGAAT